MEKNTDGTANKLELKIFNLNDDSKKFLSRQGLQITVSAGYEAASGTIFKGITETPLHYRDGVDRITEIKAQDGAFMFRNIRVKKSFKEGTTKEKIALELLAALVERPINSAGLTIVQGLQIGTQSIPSAADKKTKQSKVVMGPVWPELQQLAKGLNLKLFVVDQTVYLQSPTDSINPSPIVVSPSSGLIEIPEQLDDKRGYRFKSLLRHEFNPATQIIAETANINRGRFNIDTVKHDFESRGNNWYTEFEARPQ